MRQIILFLAVLSFLSCASTPRTNTDEINNREPEKHTDFAIVVFYNYSRDDIYLFLEKPGEIPKNIKEINIKEYGSRTYDVSLVPSGKSAEFIIPPGLYTIVPMKDRYGKKQAEDFDEYEEFYFFPYEEPYIIRLFPKHKQTNTTTATITPSNSQINSQNSLFPSFDIQFSDEMIKPLVDENITLSGEDNKPIKVDIQWPNDYKLTIRPQESLQPSTQYFVRVENGARNVECERIKEVIPYPFSFRTGNIVDSVSPFDTTTVKYTSIPGKIQLDWTLPPGTKGSEILIPGKLPEELYAKTYYTFSNDVIEEIKYKILPYGMINGEKVYNETDQRRSFTNIPRLYFYEINHTVIANTVDRLEFSFTFNASQKINPDFQFALKNKLGGADLAVLSAQKNNFTYIADNPPLIPDEEVTYILTIDNKAVDYSFTIKRPSDSEFYESFEKKVIKDMEAIAKELIAIDKKSLTMRGELGKDHFIFEEKMAMLTAIYNKYTVYTYPKAYNLESYKKRVQSNEIFSRIQNLYKERYNLLIENLIVSAASSYNTADERIASTKNYLDSILKFIELADPEFWLAVKDKRNVKAAIEKVNGKHTMKASADKAGDAIKKITAFLPHNIAIGSAFSTPLLIVSVYNNYYLLERKMFFDYGCDFGFFHGMQDNIDDVNYYSFYPNLHINGNIPGDSFQLHGGLGAGYMISTYTFPNDTVNMNTFAFDVSAGFDISIVTIGYNLRTDFKSVNHKAYVGIRIPY